VNDIDLRCCDVRDLLADVEPGSVAGVIADPPWRYQGDTSGGSGSSGAGDLYPGLGDAAIAHHLGLSYHLCRGSAYLAVWLTWPKLLEWHAATAGEHWPWRYVTGGAWCKSNGFGMGYHHAGDSELWLLYVKGSPRPADGRQTNGVTAPRLGHSEKPQDALDVLVKTVAPAGGLVLDPYAGESASLARCCRRLGRRYIGAEIDPDRHARALRRLNGESAKQAAMVGQETLFG
jgi:hypothetical protein